MDALSENLTNAEQLCQFLLENLQASVKDSNGALTVVLYQLIEQAAKIHQTVKQINI